MKENIIDVIYNDVINKTNLILSENRKLSSDLNKIIILNKVYSICNLKLLWIFLKYLLQEFRQLD